MMQKESVSKQEEDATANIDTTFDRVNLDEGMERNQRPVEVQELQPEKTKQNDAPSENVRMLILERQRMRHLRHLTNK